MVTLSDVESLLSNTDIVKAVQTRLSLANHDPGAIDGIWGERTASALRDFAMRFDVPPYVCPTTAKALLQDFGARAKLMDIDHLQKVVEQHGRIELENLPTEAVKNLQGLLNQAGYYCGAIDGKVGNHTLGQFKRFKQDQKQGDLTAIGQGSLDLLLRASRQPADIFAPNFNRPPVTDADYQNMARLLGVEVATVKAVVQVEAAGSGFLPSGRVKILFEAHLFHDFCKPKGRFSNSNSDISSPTWNRNLYEGGEDEWKRMRKAYLLDANAAMMSASGGLGQVVVGYHYEKCGYATPRDCWLDMRQSEAKQLEIMMKVIKASGWADELKRKDWAGFARQYNGPGYKQNRYDTKLKEAYDRFR